jgi:hypothetical protein
MRPDGKRVKNARLIEQFAPYLLKSKQEALIYYQQTIPVEKTFNYIREHNERAGEKEYTFFTVLLAIMVKLAPEFPQLGRFIVGKRLYQREEITYSFVVKSSKDESARNHWVKVRFEGDETIEDIAGILKNLKQKVHGSKDDSGGEADKSLKFLFSFPPFLRPLVFKCAHLLNRMNLLPAKMIKADPMFAACIIANVGSIGLNAPYHHLYEWGTNAMFLTVGKAYLKAFPHPEKGYEFKQVIDFKYTLDERVAFATFSEKPLKRMEELFKNPKELER